MVNNNNNLIQKHEGERYQHWITVIVRQLCLDRCAARLCPANSLLCTVHLCFSKSSMCISTAQARKIWLAAASACRDGALVVVPCAFLHTVDRCEGSERLNFEVHFVAGTALCEPRSADFVAGAVQNACSRDSGRTKCCVFQYKGWFRTWQG